MSSLDTLAGRLRFLLTRPPRRGQAALARACGVKPPSVTGWLNGGGMTDDNIEKVARYFAVREAWLANGSSPMREPPTTSSHAVKEPGMSYTIEPRRGADVYAGEQGHVCIRQSEDAHEALSGERVLIFHPDEVDALIDLLRLAKADAQAKRKEIERPQGASTGEPH